jgi:PAS domain S-box-containing protein
MPPYNTLAWNTALGFYRTQGYYVGGYRELAEGVRNLWGLGLLSVFYFLGLYFALVVFPFRTQTHYDLYFGLLCLFIGGYYLTREDFVFAWVDDTATLARIEYALLACGGAAGLWFLNSFFYPQRRAPWFIRIFTGLSALIALVSLTGPFRLSDTVLLAWQTMVAVGLLYLLYFIGRAAAARVPDAGKLIPGLVLLMITGFLDIADSLFFFSGISYGRIGFAVFVVSIAMVLAMRAVRTRREIKLLNEQLSEREQRLRTLFEASFESVIVHRHGTVLDVNPTFLRQFDWTTEQIVGKPVVRLFAQASRERAAALISSGDQTIIRGEALTADGKAFAAEFANRTIAYRGAPAEVLIVRDISHRKQAEDELQARNRELETMVRAMADREQRLHDLETELKTLQAKRRGT